jgi:hypothetical protein
LNGVKYLKSHSQILLDRTGVPDNLWFLSQDYLSHVHNLSANRQLNWKIPEQVSRGGGTPDLSHILMFYLFEPILYLDPVPKFQYPETTERPGYFVGFEDNIGDALTFKILKNDLVTVLHRSVVRSAADASHRNRRVSFKSDVQESLKLLDSKPGFVWKDSHHNYRSRKTNNDVSNRTRSKADYTDQHIGSKTRSKIHNINLNNLSVQKLFFPLHDVILFQGYGKSQAQDLQLGVVECKVYHNVLMNTRSQVDFDRLLQLHMLDKTEEDNEISWECCKVVDYCKEKGDINSSNHKCLVE